MSERWCSTATVPAARSAVRVGRYGPQTSTTTDAASALGRPGNEREVTDDEIGTYVAAIANFLKRQCRNLSEVDVRKAFADTGFLQALTHRGEDQ